MALSAKISGADQASISRMLVGIKNGVPRALSTSINKTIKTTQVQAVKRIGTELNLKAGRIKQDFSQNKATWAMPRGSLVAEGDPVGLINYGANVVKAGISVKVKKTEARVILKGAFKESKGTAKHIFRRDYHKIKMPVRPGMRYGALPEKYRLPVQRLTGPRIEDIYAKPKIYNEVSALAADKFAENVGKETATLLRRFG
ncbi:MAG: hypothetical protein GY941_23730 [Planctomycetes bacterium]|nr:hypothetical protein [Planctomycetota bacterium]